MSLGPEDPIRELLDDVLDGRASAAAVARFEALCRTRPDVAEEYAFLRSLRSATLRIGLERAPTSLRARIAAAVDVAAASAPAAADVVAFERVHRRIAWLRTAPFAVAAAVLFAAVLIYTPGERAPGVDARLSAEAPAVAHEMSPGFAGGVAEDAFALERRKLKIDPAAIVGRMQADVAERTDYRFSPDPTPGLLFLRTSNVYAYGVVQETAPPPARWAVSGVDTVDPSEAAAAFGDLLAMLPAVDPPETPTDAAGQPFAGAATRDDVALAADDLRRSERMFSERALALGTTVNRGSFGGAPDVARAPESETGRDANDRKSDQDGGARSGDDPATLPGVPNETLKKTAPVDVAEAERTKADEGPAKGTSDALRDADSESPRSPKDKPGEPTGGRAVGGGGGGAGSGGAGSGGGGGSSTGGVTAGGRTPGGSPTGGSPTGGSPTGGSPTGGRGAARGSGGARPGPGRGDVARGAPKRSDPGAPLPPPGAAPPTTSPIPSASTSRKYEKSLAESKTKEGFKSGVEDALGLNDDATSENAPASRSVPAKSAWGRTPAPRGRMSVEEAYFVSGANAFAAVERTLVAVGAVVRELPVVAASGASRPVDADVLPRTRFLEVESTTGDVDAALAALRRWPGIGVEAAARPVTPLAGLTAGAAASPTQRGIAGSERSDAAAAESAPQPLRRIRLVVTQR